MGLPKWLATAAATTDTRWSPTPLISKLCWSKKEKPPLPLPTGSRWLSPESEAFLQAALLRGESVTRQTRQLLDLLQDYGDEALQAALAEALQRGTPRASSVAFLLHRSRRTSAAPLPVDLRRRPELADLHVQPHSPEGYDDLSEPE